MAAAFAPVSSQQRIRNIDFLRGCAVLGILAMNIVGFAFHPSVYADPTIQGGAQGINLSTYMAAALLFDGKMRGLFTLLFGAGICLLSARADERGASSEVADVYYRRTLWLLLFGVAHAHLLWWGEVLYPYAVCGLMLYPFRRMSAKGLIILASVLCALLIGGASYEAHDAGEQLKKYNAATQLKRSGARLTEEQQGDITKWEEKLKFMKPDAEALRKNHDLNTGGFLKNIKARREVLNFFHSLPLYSPMLWDFLVMMLAGMALLKTGVLTGARSTAFYLKTAALGLAIGLPLHFVQLKIVLGSWFSVTAQAWAGAVYEPARIAMTFAYVALGMLLVRSGVLSFLTGPLAATGQMALTNYVMQSVCCTLVFNVFAWHGRLQRHQVYFVVAAIWILELAWSPIWLRHFRFGPLEWAWRSLTYWKRQPFLLSADPEPESQPASEPSIEPQQA
ncbi:MAG: DUF418 domain-containing protein [Acidobacteria bacterium]|nr:DUF418 domain-containing protein [Acidobacteriota bacterium]